MSEHADVAPEDAGPGFKAPFMPPAFHKKHDMDHPPPTEEIEEEGHRPPLDPVIKEAPPPSSAPKMSIAAPTLHYEPPPWACIPDDGSGYKLEIVKSGSIVDTFDMENRKNPTFIVVGRLPECDVILEHPSISRYHCILQYGEDTMDRTGKGWHLFDMGSTHGSSVNKRKLPPKQYVRAHVGFVMRFGGSTRVLSLLGPDSDAEPEWDCSPTEMKYKQHKKMLDAKLAAAARKEIEEEKAREEKESEGISWGMDYGEDEERSTATIELDPHLMEDREAYYNTDPRKALAKFFEREGFDMNFEYSETGAAHNHKWVCTIELPIEIDGVDRAFTASATVSTSKKDAQTQCALEACRILDAHNVLRRSNTRSRLKKKTMEENDYYDEDEDIYLDRTGQIEKQREKRKQWAEHGTGKREEEKETYETLCAKLESTKKEMTAVQKQLDALTPKVQQTTTSSDELDEYCQKLTKGIVPEDMKTKTEKSALRQRLVILTQEAQRLERFAAIAKPVSMPELKIAGTTAGADKQAFLRKMQMLGRKKKEDGAVINEVTKEQPTSSKTASSTQMPKKDPPRNETRSEEMRGPAMPAQPLVQAKEEHMEVLSNSKSFDAKPVEEKKSPEVLPELSEEPTTSAIKVEDPKESLATSEREGIEMKRKSETEVEEKEEDMEEKQPIKKKARIRYRDRTAESKAKPDEYGAGCETRDEQYATWIPPTNQSGDGKTKLHEKFAGKY